MHKQNTTVRLGQIATGLLIVGLLGACAQTKSLVSSMGRASTPTDDAIILGAPDAEQYLSELYDLATGNPKLQSEIYADAESGAKLTPGPQTNLRYAMILATPGHDRYNPEIAQNMLRDVLMQESILTPAEVALATIHLKSVEKQISSSVEARRALATNSLTATTEEAAVQQRLSVVEAENRRLRQELTDAEEKLDAITSIERSIREQDQ